MNIGIVGLGLIGGSLAKAYKQKGHTVYGYDLDNTITSFVLMSKAIDGILGTNTIKSCDCILIAIYPKAVHVYLESAAAEISTNTVVIDCCGTKTEVCKVGFAFAEKYGFTFIGGHPMAGSHKSGFKNSRANLFNGAPMIVVPPTFDDMAMLDKVKNLLEPIGFGKITVTTAEKHDEMIAFTSQMAHIVSNAYIKSPTVGAHKGFSAGSYKDLTRVAWLNPYMWTELFFENKNNLIRELDCFMKAIAQYRSALVTDDTDRMIELLEEGRRRKEVDSR